jgi:hypothetical protein
MLPIKQITVKINQAGKKDKFIKIDFEIKIKRLLSLADKLYGIHVSVILQW